jgi:uncharacterized membrane protein
VTTHRAQRAADSQIGGRVRRRTESQEEAFESRWEAAPAVGAIIVLQALLAGMSMWQGWRLWVLPWWVWLVAIVPELVLLVSLARDRPRQRLERSGNRRAASILLLAIVSLANAIALGAMIGSLIIGQERSGGELLFKAVVIWATNVTVFGLSFWTLDRGGPARRIQPHPLPPDFQFPQMENPDLAEPGWYPRLEDYIYVSFTNAFAFSPTDAMPLTRQAKRLMLIESAVSVVTVVLVAGRAVNILH